MSKKAANGIVLEGKFKGEEIFAYQSTSSLGIGSPYAPKYKCLVSDITVVNTQDLGTTTQNANPEAVLKASFWFGVGAAIVTNQIGTHDVHTVAVEYRDGEKSLLQLDSHAYQVFKSIEFAVNEKIRKEQQDTPAITSKTSPIIDSQGNSPAHPTINQVATRRQIIINTDNIKASIKRAMLFLEDEEWETADEYFDSILDVEPENPLAYLGKLLVKHHLSKVEDLCSIDESVFEDRLFIRALRFADEDLKRELESLRLSAVDNKMNSVYEQGYQNAINTMKNAKSIDDYKEAARQFRKLGNYKDSNNLAPECEITANDGIQKEYFKAIELMNQCRYMEAIRTLALIINYEDSKTLCVSCAEKNNAERTKLAHQANDKHNELQAAQSEKKELSELVVSLSKKISDYSSKQEELSFLKSKQQQTKIKLGELESELSSLGVFAVGKKAKINTQIKQYQTELYSIDERVAVLEAITYTKEDANQDEKQIHEAQQQIDSLQQKINNLESQIATLKEKISVCDPYLDPNLFFSDNLFDFGIVYDSMLLMFRPTKIENSFLLKYNIRNVVIAKGVTEIGYFAFSKCENLYSITLPDSITKIDSGAFSGCKNLSNISIPNGVKTIGEFAFSFCDELVSVNIPDGVTSIGKNAFANCIKLESISIPESVTHLGSSMFMCCNSLKKASLFASVSVIGTETFHFCKALTSISIPDSVTVIEQSAFAGCDQLKSVSLSKKLSDIGDDAFYNCKSLTNIAIPEGTTRIGQNAFFGCEGLTKILLPDTVLYIDKGAFSCCSSLSSVKLPKGARIASDAFSFTSFKM